MNEQLYINFIDRLIEDRRYISEGMDPGGASIWHELFGGPGHSDPHWKAAFNAVRHGAIYAGYLSREMNDSMFDDSFGDMTERTGESAMCSAFAKNPENFSMFSKFRPIVSPKTLSETPRTLLNCISL